MSGFPPDFAVDFRGQIYRAVGTHLHTRADGEVVPVADWETACPDCGAVFRLFTTMTFREPWRRCDLCKSPGRRVNP